MILLDTSVLVDALTGPFASVGALRAAIERGELLRIPTLVLFEWLRGPRLPEELAAQEALFPADHAVAFGAAEAHRAAELYRAVKSPRGREIDLGIAACCLVRDAALWTLNERDFRDVPGLRLAPGRPA